MRAAMRAVRGIPFAAGALALVFAAGCGGGEDPGCVPSAEVCNGFDDDCDGEADEGFDVGAACTAGAGACAASGRLACAADHLSAACDATPGAPGVEACNGIDDDCDGAVDDGDPGGGGPCATGLQGVCASGVLHCASGALACVQGVASGSEACNGLDDDCDGSADEEFGVGAPCAAGVGGCARSGTIACAADGLSSACGAVPGSPAEEACNGIDDDCDGAADEGDPGGGGACATGLLGLCDAGVLRCVGGALACAQVNAPSPETCDGLDDDCDGAVDEGFGVGGTCTVGVGACARTGAIACDPGGLSSCGALAGDPATEACGNGIDDDCDGAVDEGCTPYSHTIAMNTLNDFDPAKERFDTTTEGYSAYVTWDATYLYVGYEFATPTLAANLLVYLDVRAGDAGLPAGPVYGTQRVTFPDGFTADYERGLRPDATFIGSDVVNGEWARATWWALQAGLRGSFVQMRIPLWTVGDPTTFGLTMVLLDPTPGAEWTYEGLYRDAFVDGYDRTVSTYLLVDRTSSAPPNAPQNKR